MSQRLIYRVAGDAGPRIDVTHRGLIATGLTITARFVNGSGGVYTLTATVTEVGDGGDTPAQYYFTFGANDLVAGEHKFDFHYSGASIDDYSIPAREKFVMRVRDA